MGNNYLIESKTGIKLYNKYAKNMPIFDYHCHLNAKDIYENKTFRNLTQVWLCDNGAGDHYKWRAMRSHGISEEFITGSKEEQEAWLEEWKKNINEALAYQQGLQNNFGRDEQEESSAEIPSVEEMPNIDQETTIKTTPEIGERVELKSGKKIYGSYDAQKGVNPYFGVGPYTVLRTKNGRVQVKYANAKTGGAIGWLNFKDLVGYSRGGLVTDTGPVMVHGSKQRPEAFLSADDTKLIMNLKNALASMTKRNDVFGTSITNAEKAGDTFYEIHIHVDELNNDYDVEQMMTAMERKIVNDARSRNVIAIKRSR